ACESQRLLERRAAGLANVPVVVHVAGHTFRLRQAEVGARVDWAGAVDAARAKADGFGPIRGFRRLFVRAFGVTITPTASVEGHALDSTLDQIVAKVGRRPRDAALELHGLRPIVVPGRIGLSIDRAAARKTILDRFAGLSREPVVLPLGAAQPRVTASMLASAAGQVRTAVSLPVYLRIGSTRYRIPRWQV